MSFRARLTTFFILIVVIPMTAMGVLVFGLIDSSATGRADSRAAGIAGTAASVYRSDSRSSSLDARGVARALARTPRARWRSETATLLRETGLARIDVRLASGRTVSVGARTAIAPGIAVIRAGVGHPAFEVSASEVTAGQFARELAGSESEIVVGNATRTLGSSLGSARDARLLSERGTVTIAGTRYRVVTERFAGFSSEPITVSALSGLAATSGGIGRDRLVALAFIVGFLVLAFFFTLLVSQSLQTQISHFLQAARRLGEGDFSAPVQTVGSDEFAELGGQFNAMSEQLRDRLDELDHERARFRASVRRIGEAFASALDRDALLDLALSTAIDAVSADRGRVTARMVASSPLLETCHVGALGGLQAPMREVERQAQGAGIAVTRAGDAQIAAVALGSIGDGEPIHGVITVVREARPFTDDDLELLRSLAARATLALANVDMHRDVVRQAITDDLTGLASRGHFEDLLENELHEAARYRHPVAVAMFDIDNFKSVNDTYGHPQGDLVLRRVAEALRGCCREADAPARYGGEEMAIILPHTDVAGAEEIAERARAAVEGLAVPRLDHAGWLKVTVSVGVADTVDGDRGQLVAAADAALYEAKRSGKNRVVRGAGDAAAVLA